MSWAVIRSLSPDLRTLPSSTLATLSLRAISAMSTSLPLNENDEARNDAQLWNLGQEIDQLFRDAIGEVLLVLVRAHVQEGQHGDRTVGRSDDSGR